MATRALILWGADPCMKVSKIHCSVLYFIFRSISLISLSGPSAYLSTCLHVCLCLPSAFQYSLFVGSSINHS
jgi:hypothetical protein